MRTFKKPLSLLLALITLSGCTSTNLTTDQYHDRASQKTKVYRQTNFQVSYPAYAQLQKQLPSSYFIPSKAPWTLAPNSSATQGKVLAQFVYYNIKPHPHDIYFPSYFYVATRVSVSSDLTAIQNCLKVTNTFLQNTQPSTFTNRNGITFSVIPFQDNAMSQMIKGESYRVIHNHQCWAIERFETGNSARTTDPNPKDISLDKINAYYDATQEFVNSFKFL